MKICDVSYVSGYGKECKGLFDDCVWWDEEGKICKIVEGY